MIYDETKKRKYSENEELINYIAYGACAAFGLAAFVLILIKTIPTFSLIHILSATLYGLSIIALFIIPCLYRLLKSKIVHRVVQSIEKNTVFILLAGSFTPYSLIAMRGQNLWGWGEGVAGYVILGLVWSICILAIIFNSISIHDFAWLSMLCYLACAWLVIFSMFGLWNILPSIANWLLLGSIVIYIIGAIVHGYGQKNNYFNAAFYFIILIAAAMMFVSVFNYVY